jgi:DNA mismatch repair protein MutS
MNEDMYMVVQTCKTATPKIQRFFKLLHSDTFKAKSSIIANYGKILVAYKLMHEILHDLEPMLCALGELDIYMSIARLYKEFEHERVRYTFPHYSVHSSKPSIVIKDLWSPFIAPSYVVPNSIELGTHNVPQHNLIITGPNEGGKSTFVRTVTILLVLAQSIGIVPAVETTITPFSYIATYLNITDDYGKSLFAAQVQRVKHILDHIDGMAPNKYSFVVIDELFNGTSAAVGEATAHSVADYLSRKSDVISFFPTHFSQLTLLQKNEHSINYSVSAIVNDQGDISYPFILEKGASTQNIVFDILRNEGFNKTIINQAIQRLENKVLDK